MKNFVQNGEMMTYTAPGGGVVSGTAYLIGSLLVVATHDADATDPFTGLTRGVVSYTKPGSQAWTEGVKIYWDDSAKKMTTTSSANTLVGVAAEAVGSGAGETTGKVRLDGVAR
jgi:predicted RecA/RadA family phage recombinase